MNDATAGKPLYMQVRESLARRIATGSWPPGGRLPGEMELCRLYSVSRITIRQALKELEDEGRIERKQGRGTTVKPQQFVQRLSGMYSFSEELAKLGAAPSSKILEFDVRQAEDAVAGRLAIGRGAPVYRIKRLRLAGSDPYALEESYIPCILAGNLARESVEQRGLYNALQESAGISPQQAEETFSAAALPPDIAPLLRARKNSPAMLVERVASWRGVPVEYCVSWIRADRFSFKVELNGI